MLLMEVAILLSLFTLTQAAATPQNANDTISSLAATGYKNVAYFVNWAIYGRNFNPQDLPGQELTYVVYAFADIRPDTSEVYLTDTWSDTEKRYPADSWNDVSTNVYGCAKQLFLLKKQNCKLKETFASSAIKILADLGFDSLDVNWEYPANEAQPNDIVSLLAETQRQLNDYLTYHNANFSPSPSNPSSTPFSTKKALDDYISAGVPVNKIVLSMPLYGRSFTQTDGLGRLFQGVGQGTWEVGQGLGGVMWWESSSDKKGADSLISIFVNNVGGISALDQSANLLSFPQSKYENLRGGFPNS
ncbi:glycoside hydrolase family 18 protein [Plenodomus tracheiphilus IPT5]|uniref:chitinase n=1 Tax=Plenodomus tracheiphilus IPT5 TaxID=1408161 RepID=A0A6A7AM85_9PLEO|nr:glycoside hydrolase family 18 protein [Plenodomus tracheiphilus IPT5]